MTPSLNGVSKPASSRSSVWNLDADINFIILVYHINMKSHILNPEILHPQVSLVLCQDLVQVKMRFSSS